MADLYANFVFCQATAPVGSSDTTITVDDVSTFPSNGSLAASDFYLVIEGTLMAHPSNFEVVKLTNVNSGTKTLTVTRAQDGTTAVAHASGVYLKAALTAGMLTRLSTPSGVTDTTATHYRGAWSSTGSYAVNDVVIYNNRSYVCTSAVSTLPGSSFVGDSGAADDASSSQSGPLTLPSGTRAGDLIIVSVTAISGTVLPSGFTAILDNVTHYGSSTNISVGSRVATSGDLSTGTITIPAQSGRWAATCQVFRNVTTTVDPATVNYAAGGNTTSPPTITPTSDCFAVYAMCDIVTDTTTPSMTGVTAFTWREDTTAYYVMSVLAYEPVAAGTTSTVRSLTSSTSGGRQTAISFQLATVSGGSFQTGSFTELGQQSTGRRVITNVTANTTAAAATGVDYVYFANGAITLTLPTAVGNTSSYTIKNVGSSSVAVATTASQQIDGGSLSVAAGTASRLLSDGANWRTV